MGQGGPGLKKFMAAKHKYFRRFFFSFGSGKAFNLRRHEERRVCNFLTRMVRTYNALAEVISLVLLDLFLLTTTFIYAGFSH